ncbi:MAG TPA: sugar phosphate isomerase/epimerase family protein [Syntrophales bacterium]|nr:sugar phosphate isomerase/epimerase family protein [Syntrophales bacterium]
MKRDVIAGIQVHMPFHFLRETFLSTVLAEGINPEVAINHRHLEGYPREAFREVGLKLQEAGLRVTIHAPFLDLRPGAIDPKIRRVTADRIAEVLDLAGFFSPSSIVCHAAFDERYYLSGEEQWLHNSVETFRAFLPRAEELACPICVENVYETEPTMLRRLLDGVDSPFFRFCFDTGHCNVFSDAPMGSWIDVMSPYLGQLHIHDNQGVKDQHLPPGDGKFPFADLFAVLKKRRLKPVITLETHSVENFRRAVERLDVFGWLPLYDEESGSSGRQG